MNEEAKIEHLEEKLLWFEKENRALRAMLKSQFIFGQKIVEIVAKMDCQLDEKKKKIETLELNCSMLNESINTLGHSLALARAGLDEKNDLLDDIIIIEDEGETDVVETEVGVDKEVEQNAEERVAIETVGHAEVENENEKEVEMSDEEEIELVKENDAEIENALEEGEKVEQVVEKNENELSKPTDLQKIQFERNKDGKFECPYSDCLYIANQRSNLKSHIRARHTGERPYSCEYCEMKFVRSDSCKQHMKNMHTGDTHTGKKLFSCQFCDKRFTMSNSRDRHQLTHKESNSVNCKLCYRKFKSTEIENHSQRCGKRKTALKRKRPEIEEESRAQSQFVSFIV